MICAGTNRMSIKKRTVVVLACCPLVLCAACAVYAFVLTDSTGQPYCHKVVDTALHNWQDANQSKVFPNVNGDSSQSLAALTQYLGGEDLSDRYMYVPGLSRDDPGELVLMYLPQPTRWTWHGQKPSVFEVKAWLIVPVDMKTYGPDRDAGPGEFSERVSLTEFQQRLQATLEFLEEQKRPDWQTIVRQHSGFLEQLPEPDET